MENLIIAKNDYVQPTEVRMNIVQAICDHIIAGMNSIYLREEDIYDIYMKADGYSYKLYADLNKDGDIRGFSWRENKNLKQIRVRTCEMKAAFDALQDNGYFIYPQYEGCGSTLIFFSKKPYLKSRAAERENFNFFID